ncbi:MAG: hypothetical protein H6509_01620 [Bryobacterales bacterium]|nr:hypothetical protein [Bryobacterales bacterium]
MTRVGERFESACVCAIVLAGLLAIAQAIPRPAARSLQRGAAPATAVAQLGPDRYP